MLQYFTYKTKTICNMAVAAAEAGAGAGTDAGAVNF